MVQNRQPQRMLQGYRVLDLTDAKGLLCGKLLADLGADVIKVEKPGGDEARNIGPFLQDIVHPERSLFWLALNTNKRGITLNIGNPEGQELFRKLVKGADVVVESFAPGYLDGLELGYPALSKINPRLIMTSITPFGQSGPYRNYKGADIVCWALGGKLLLTGDADRPPVHISQAPHAWFHGSADAAAGTAMALYRRGISGQGQYLDISIQESMEKVGYLSHLTWVLSKRQPVRGPVLRTPPSGTVTHFVWPAKDGWVAFYPFTGPMGPLGTRPVVEYMDSEGMADDFIRGIRWETLDWGHTSQREADRIAEYFRRFFQTKTKGELFAASTKKQLLLQPVFTAKDVYSHPQLQARGYWQRVEHAEFGKALLYPGTWVRTSEAMSSMVRRAPLIGEHNEEIYLKELRISRKRLNQLRNKGVT